VASLGEQPSLQRRMRGIAETGEGFLAQLLGDGVQGGVGGCLEDERGLAHERGTLGRARSACRRDGGVGASVHVTGEVGRPAERDQHLTALGGGQRSWVEGQGRPVKADALFVGETPYGVVGGADRPLAGGGRLTVGRELDPMPGDLAQVLGKVAGEACLGRLGDGAMQRGPVGGRERRLDRVAGQGMDEPVVTDVADPVEQAVRDRLVDQRKAPLDGLVERGRDERKRDVAPDDRRRLDQPAAVGGDPADPRTDDVEHGARRPVRAPGAVGHRTGDLTDEQRVAAGDLKDGASVGREPLRGRPGQLLAHLGQVEATQVQALDPH
jgi:hypothetical protein